MVRRALRRRFGHGVAASAPPWRCLRPIRRTDPSALRLHGRVKEGRFCTGRMRNGPGKRFTRCDRCGDIYWEKNEGDRCERIIA